MLSISTPPTEGNGSHCLNVHGDVLVSTTGTHGADISSQRLDSLDLASLRFALEVMSVNRCAVDLGCGLGVHSLRLASLGYNVTMIDILDRTEFCQTANGLLNRPALHDVMKDARLLTEGDLPIGINLLYSQRFFHYLKFDEAKAVLEFMTRRMLPGSKAFLSTSGLKPNAFRKVMQIIRNCLAPNEYKNLSPSLQPQPFSPWSWSKIVSRNSLVP